MGPKLELRNEQKLILTPMLQHALKMLQLPTLELTSVVNQELSENPMLDEKEEEDNTPKPATEVDNGVTPDTEKTSEVEFDQASGIPTGIDQGEWERYFSDDDYTIPKYDREVPAEYTVPQVAKQPTLAEHLLWQLRMICTDEQEFQIGELIIGNLDERGFFTLPLLEIAQVAGCEETRVADVLSLVQTLEPLGVGASDVIESLLIQLKHLSERNTLAEKIVEHHFLALEKQQWERIARAEKIPLNQVQAAAKIISSLDPYPGRHQFTGPTEYVLPDVIVEKHDDEYIIIVNDDNIPQLRISQTYRKLMRRKSSLPAETKKYLEDKLQRAAWMIRSIDQRRKTLYRVVDKIVEVQVEFFEKGIRYLKPLTLSEIAQAVELHESTISRVTSKKYVQTPRGMFELKYFFSSHIMTSDGGSISSTSVKATLQELIEQEDGRKPLSDQRLTEKLKEKGFEIARRTVAKYREELNILPASRRKKIR